MSDKTTSTTSTTSTPSKAGSGNGNGNGGPAHSAGSGSEAPVSLQADVKGLGSDVKSIASDVAREAQKLAEAQLDSRRELVAEGIGSVAGAIRSTGDQLRQSPVGGVSDYLNQAADTVQNASKYLENKSVGEVVSDVESFARREPLIFLGGTFAVGLLLGRFLKSASPEGRFRDQQRFQAQAAERGPEGRSYTGASSYGSGRDQPGYGAPQSRSQGVTPSRNDSSRNDSGRNDSGRNESGASSSQGSSLSSSQGSSLSSTQGSSGSASTVAKPTGSSTAAMPTVGTPSTTTPLSTGPLASGPLTTGPVSTASSVGTDLPVSPTTKPASTGSVAPSTGGPAKKPNA